MDAAEAFRTLQADPKYGPLLRDAYMTDDPQGDAERFAASAEFIEVERLLRPDGKEIVDLGAGTGIASLAFARAGAKRVYAVEPDASRVGRAAIVDVCAGLPVRLVDASGEELPLPDESVDAIYARQVLHHARGLEPMLRECARVLRRGGVFLASREHVVDDDEQLSAFLAAHPAHQLAGNEHAHPLGRYLDALRAAPLRVAHVLGPWDTILNAFPAVQTQSELRALRRAVAREAIAIKFGPTAAKPFRVPLLADFAWRRLPPDDTPGRLYSFIARKA